MGSPSFAKPDFVSGVAVMHDPDYSDETILEFRKMNEYDSEEEFSDDDIIAMISEIEFDFVREKADDVEANLKRIKGMVDTHLNFMLPENIEFEFLTPFTEDWFSIERVNAYNGDGIGFEVLPSAQTPEPYSNYSYADAFWDYILNKEQLESQGVTFKDIKGFFDVLESAYDYLMLAVAYELYADKINGGWCDNTSEVEDKPEPAECLVGTGIIELINAELSRFNDTAEHSEHVDDIPLCELA